MAEDRLVEVEFLEEDLRGIRGGLDIGCPEDERLHVLLSTGLEQFQRDEASWEALRDRDDSLHPQDGMGARGCREDPARVSGRRGAWLSAGDIRDELGAARGELATLRHRAYMADEAIRTLEMNTAGITAALRQFEKSLPALEHEEADLRARMEILLAEAAQRGVEPEATEGLV